MSKITRRPSRRRRQLPALALAVAAFASPLIADQASADTAPAARQPDRAQDHSAQDHSAYDHSNDKALAAASPAPDSATEVSVKFRADREVRIRDRRLVARDGQDAAAIRAVMDRHPGATIRPLRPATVSEDAATEERVRLERRVGHDLPDLNSWFAITVPSGAAALANDLNALPAVEIAQVPFATVAPAADPFRPNQVYRNPVGASAGTGIGADGANALPGGKGENVTVTDIEAGTQDRVAVRRGAIAAGQSHALAVIAEPGAPDDRTVRAWGAGGSGQLGIGTTANSSVYMRVTGLTNVESVAAGTNFSVALKTDGTVWTWGANNFGQLGLGDTATRLAPAQVPGLTGVRTISANGGHVLAVRSDGTVRAWGNNANGQLGVPPASVSFSATPITVPGLTGVSTQPGGVSAGFNHSLALLTTGAARAWGAGGSGQLGNGSTASSAAPVPVTGVTDAVEIVAGGLHSVARLAGGTLMGWGNNFFGQVGDGGNANRTTPQQVTNLNSVVTLAAGNLHNVAVNSDGTLWAWGAGGSGQLGTGTTADQNFPVEVLPAPADPTSRALVGAGTAFSLGVGSDGIVWGWGTNAGGQLGTGDTTASQVQRQAVTMRNLWNTCHEELANRPAPAGPPVRLHPMVSSPCAPVAVHGTAVVGIVAAQEDNGLGVTGLLPRAKLQLASSADAVGAMTLARQNSQPGDVILAEVALAVVGGSQQYPWELNAAVYDQIVLATAAGVTVVEAAGNGGNSLDDPADPRAALIMGRPDSGAIVVGAGEPPNIPGTAECVPGRPAERTSTAFSTHGQRVNLQAYGKCIATLGGGPEMLRDLTPTATDPNKMYWSNMNGTSGASPIVVGAVGAVQSIAQQSGPALTPAQVRQLLVSTGTPQPAADPRHIGPLPNLQAAIAAM
ncbi:RCC1 domain-containing protein [Actinokineospora iranica]|uniref:Alpha-tubulin suppressor n=1 Tax=Actinokineospora iranica TaxID=1271860 RepID=A0A1G6S3W6_9PSEU|nr:S8 family serine peptidase [Actinokineospora iranica]SDD10856.1 Alpha-tubulin suppressor [Actinokineospora iranica]